MNKITNKKNLNIILLLTFVAIIDYIFTGHINGHTIFSALILIIIFNLSRVTYKIVIILLSVLTSIYIPMQLQYEGISYNMVLASFFTNEEEAFEFMHLISIKSYIYVLLFILFGIFTSTLKQFNLDKKKIIISIAILIGYFCFNVIKEYRKENQLVAKKIIKFPVIKTYGKLYLFYIDILKEYNKIKNIQMMKDSWEITENNNEKEAIVIVLGESVRKDFMSAYDLSISNTPFMSNSNGVIFTNFVSAASNTVNSILRTICIPTDEKYQVENNIISLSKKANMQSYWLSNQGRIGLHDSPFAAIGGLADYSFFLKKGDYGSNTETKDEFLLPTIQTVLNEKTDKCKLIIVHLMGSHPLACERTNGHHEHFVKSEEISCYIQSIANTDKLLEQVHSLVKESYKNYSMIYLSDHGLEVDSNGNMTHGDKYKENFLVPLFIWNNDSEKQIKIDSPRTSRDFLHLFCQLHNIKTKNINQEYNFISKDSISPRTVMGMDEQKINFEELPNQIFNVE